MEKVDGGMKGGHSDRKRGTSLGTLALAWSALGVIYGDIGTSPLYVYATIFSKLQPVEADVLGAVSLIFWTLTSVVLVKYVGIVLMADDDGEGGTFALYSLLCRKIGVRPHSVMYRGEGRALSESCTPLLPAAKQQPTWWRRLAANGSAVRRTVRRSRSSQLALWCMTMAATGMVLGDGVLTPAISVMSAVSGLKQATPAINNETVVGVSIAILVLLYSVQRLGTHKVSFMFAPVVALWLIANAAIAAYNLSRYGGRAFAGLSPHHIVLFFERHGLEAWRMLGGVMLCVTGAEALYADLGHFDRKSVMVGFAFFAYPCLALTYIGQGAFLLHDPESVADTFWKSLPRPVFYPMLILAFLASVVASQALITGAFSIISNAIKLGAFPKLAITHTSATVRGQIYIPEINWMLMLLCIAVVAGFQDTVALGNAYGLTVSSVFLITTLLVILVMVAVWEVSLLAALPFALFFLTIEAAFLSANLEKVPQGGWFTLAVSAGVFYIMSIWWAGSVRRTRLLLTQSAASQDLSDLFVMLQPPVVPPPPQSQQLQAADEALASGSSATAGSGGSKGGTFTPHALPSPTGAVASACLPSLPLHGSADSAAPLAKPSMAQPSSSTAATTTLGPQLAHRSAPARTSTTTTTTTTAAPPREIVTASNSINSTARTSTAAAPAAATAARTSVATSSPAASALLSAVSARLSLWRPVQLALRLSDGQLWALSRQPGIGLYYSETPVGLPHVLLHFLKNVQSMHDVSIFMTVRFMPMPHVKPEERLLVRQVQPIPNFYQVVARYGYLDKVDHGPRFVSQLVDAVIQALRRQGPAGGGGGGGGGGSRDDFARSSSAAEAALAAQQQDEDDEDEDPLEGVASPPPEVVVPSSAAVTSGAAAVAGSSGALAAASTAAAAAGSRSAARGSSGPEPQHHALQLAAAAAMVDEKAVAHILEALKHGVVYYFGNVRVRAEPTSPLLYQLLFGSMYRGLLALSHSDVEDWRLPYDHVVELGIVLRI